MKFLFRVLLRIAANIVALYAAAIYIDGFTVNGDWRTYVALGVVFTLLNAIVRPVAKTFAGPLIVLTIGLFTIVVNALMFVLLDFGSNALTISGYVPLLLATLLAGVVNFVFYLGRRALGLGK